jgi:hypothetical protein
MRPGASQEDRVAAARQILADPAGVRQILTDALGVYGTLSARQASGRTMTGPAHASQRAQLRARAQACASLAGLLGDTVIGDQLIAAIADAASIR